MSKTKLWITILLTVIVLALIGWNMTDFSDDTAPGPANDQDPTYQSQHTVTVVYNPAGKLNYKLVAEDAKYYTAGELSWFTQPVMTLFDENAVATWSVRADRAKLTKDRMLYLYGHVEVNSLTTTSQLEKIKTDNAQVNLVTQDVTSDDEVTLYGTNFTSNGMKMRGNLRTKTAELIDKVKTNYEIQNQNQLRNLLIGSLVLAASAPALALKSDSSQPVSIDSLKQSLDMQSNVSTFTDNVVIKQGTIDIRADKVVVTRPGGDQNKTYIEAFGNPVTFYQMQDSGKPVKGHAQKVRYDVATQLVTLTGNAYLEQLDSNVKGDRITYLVQQQQMQAFSDKGKRVTTVLVPSQLQDKNGQKKSN